MNMIRQAFIISLLCLSAQGAMSKVKLSPLFSSGMVLQQQSDVPLWGEAKAGSKVVISTSWNGTKYTTQAGADGQWRIKVTTPKAGGPYSITISDGKPLTLSDVLIGEVWLCSGQSNMEMPVEGWGKVMNYKQEEAEADSYPQIRLLQVKKAISPTPLSSIEANTQSADGRPGWQQCSAKSVAEFSATAYFFGRSLHKSLNVPIGLIDASWGGTYIEPWTSREALSQHPDLAASLDDVAAMAPDKETRRTQYQKKVEAWHATEMKADKGYDGDTPAYAQPSLDDSAWQQTEVPSLWEHTKGWENVDGVVWMRKTINIPSAWNGRELTVSLGQIDDIDYTFFEGQAIGATYELGPQRLYTVPKNLVRDGKAILTVRVVDMGGLGGIFSDAKQLYIECPRSADKTLTRISLAGTWRMSHTTELSDMAIIPVNDAESPNKPTLLFNAMISPVVPYGLRGAIWYQGCANERRGYQYRELLPTLISDWRTQWSKAASDFGINSTANKFPFYIVQLANYQTLQTDPCAKDQWAEVREAQSMAAQHVAASGLACTIDIGEAGDIHPKNKQEVGRRLALLARANDYGQNVETSGPQYRSYTIEGQNVRIKFDHAQSGLQTSDGGDIKGFIIAGPDRQFHWATAKVDGTDIIVSSPEVACPLAVRYAWAQNPICNLQNKDRLPAVPFRTDDWPGASFGVVNNGPALR